MKKTLFFIFLCVGVLGAEASKNWLNDFQSMQSTNVLKKSYLAGILSGKSYGKYSVDSLYSPSLVKKFYKKRDYETYWITGNFDLNSNLFGLVDAIDDAYKIGLDSRSYHQSEISEILSDIKNRNLFTKKDKNLAIGKLDILLTDLFFTLSKDVREGSLDYYKFNRMLKNKSEAEEINYTWTTSKKKMDYISFLDKAVSTNDMKKAIYSLQPDNQIYQKLKNAYIKYQAIEASGGWQKIPGGKTLRLGVVDGNRVPILTERLYKTGDLLQYDPFLIKVTPEVSDAIKNFQRRMGLTPSGVLNRSTRNALNIPVEVRLRQIKLNLERSRWESQNFGDNYILINIPDFRMNFIRHENSELSMRVVVGTRKNPTPIFQSKMSYFVVNPTWTVPSSIVLKEMLTKLQDDPDYLSTRKFKMYSDWSKNRKEIDSFDIDWYAYTEESKLPYSFVREPGKGNPLGSVKFIFPNRHAVYMHDTPSKKYFKRNVRAFSHGCIRLAQPQKLLELLSNNFTDLDYANVKKLQKSAENKSIPLSDKIPVYIRYYTAWSDENGNVSFRNDIYGYDALQYKILN